MWSGAAFSLSTSDDTGLLRKSLPDGGFPPQNRSGEGNDFDRDPWNSPHRLTLSFAPDGTGISKYQSDLFELFSGLLTAEELQQTILSAFQTWARESNVNVGLVADGGQPFGAGGLTQGDPRFGDIRVGSVPMADNVFAAAVPYNLLVSGTWGGDLLFNSNQVFTSASQVYAIALHEAGHVLGLGHSSDPHSVMNPGVLNSTLSAGDIQELQDLYGLRHLDQYDEPGDMNNTFDDATKIENPGSLDGQVPYVVYGDIGSASDVDYYFLPPLSGYNSSITFRVLSRGVSAVGLDLTLFDESGNMLDHVAAADWSGTEVSLTVPAADDGESYHIRVASTPAAGVDVGSYALVATLDANVTAAPALIDDVMLRNYAFLDQSDVREVFINPDEFYFALDLGLNDTPATAEALNSVLGFPEQTHYRVEGSVSVGTDVDYYSIEAPDFGGSSGTLTLSLGAMEDGGLIGDLRIMNQNVQPLQSRILINGNGELVVQVDGIASNEIYFVAVSADKPGGLHNTGNYRMIADFVAPAAALTELGTGVIRRAGARQFHALYVAEPQMFHFAVAAASANAQQVVTIWMTIYADDGTVVYRGATRPGETRTGKSIVLRPGSYSIEVVAKVPGRTGIIQRERLSPVSYQILGDGVTDPIGPEILDPTENPFQPCEPGSRDYCYPGNIYSPDPFIVVEGNQVPLPPGSNPAPPYMEPNQWYWVSNWLEPPNP